MGVKQKRCSYFKRENPWCRKSQAPLILEVSCNLCDNLVIAKNPTPLAIENHTRNPVVAPSVSNMQENTSFEATYDHIKSCYECVSNLKENKNENASKHIDNEYSLKDEKLSNLV